MHWRCVVNVTIVAQAEGDMGTNVFEVTAEDDLPVGDCDRGCLFKVVIDIFTFSAFFSRCSCCRSVLELSTLKYVYFRSHVKGNVAILSIHHGLPLSVAPPVKTSITRQ
jgi:hypothetical protein